MGEHFKCVASVSIDRREHSARTQKLSNIKNKPYECLVLQSLHVYSTYSSNLEY